MGQGCGVGKKKTHMSFIAFNWNHSAFFSVSNQPGAILLISTCGYNVFVILSNSCLAICLKILSDICQLLRNCMLAR